jgi:hypothetical protein
MSDEFLIEDKYGLVCVVKDDHEQWEAPLVLLEVGDGNHQALEDDRHGFTAWGDFTPVQLTHGSPRCHDSRHHQDEYEELEPLVSKKVDGNDSCPCGGRKFKKCCLSKRYSTVLG